MLASILQNKDHTIVFQNNEWDGIWESILIDDIPLTEFVETKLKNVSSILKDEFVVSLLEFAKNKMIVHVSSRDLMILHDWKVVKVIMDPVYSNTLKFWI